MLSSIHPFGERNRNSRWGITAAAHLVGGLAGGATIGSLAAAISSALRRTLGGDAALTILAVVALAGLAAELHLGPMRIPTLQRQVDERWITTYRGWVYGIGFGFQLGLGVATIVTTSAVWTMLVASALAAHPAVGLLAGLVFGGIRGASVLSTRRIEDPSALRRLHRGIADRSAAVARATTVIVAAVAATAVLGAIS